ISSSDARTGRSSCSSSAAMRWISSRAWSSILGATAQPRHKTGAICEGGRVLFAQRLLFSADPDSKQQRIAGGEREGGQPATVNQRHARHLHRDRGVVRVANEAVGTAGHWLVARHDNDAHVPARLERPDSPVPEALRSERTEKGDGAEQTGEGPI